MTQIVVSTTGSPTGAGTKASPIDILTAIGASSPALPGDEILLRVGTYTPLTAGGVVGATATNGSAVAGKGVYTLLINGTVGNNITIRNYPGESVRINGAIHIVAAQSNYITIRGLEIAATPTTRTFAAVGDVDYPGIYITGAGCKLINNYIHDLMQAYIFGTGGIEIHGNLIGWTGAEYSASLNGYCIYTHNHNGGDMLFRKNAFVMPFNGTATGMWSGSNNNIRDYYVEDNVCYGAGLNVGSASATNDDNNHINRNYMYFNQFTNYIGSASISSGTSDNVGGDGEGLVECTGNYIVLGGAGAGIEPLYIKYGREYDIQNNTFVTNAQSYVIKYLVPTGATKVGSVIDYNTYRRASTAYFASHSALGDRSFAQWQAAMSQDANSTFTGSLPTTNVTKLVGNDYDHCGFVAIFNWESLSQVTIDISSLGLTHTKTCRIRNCLNYSEYIDFVYDSSEPNITIPMGASSWSSRQPTAWDIVSVTWPTEPFPAYGLFFIEELEDVESDSVISGGGRSATCNVYDYKEFTKYESPDGQVYKFDVLNDRFLISEAGWGMPPINYITQRSPLQHGETLLDYRLNPRVIQIIHRRNGRNRSEYFDNRANILNLLRPNRNEYSGKTMPPIVAPGRLVKMLPDGKSYAVDVMIEQGPEFAARDSQRWDEWAFTETLRFIAHDPILYDIVEKSHTFTLAQDNQLKFPFSFPVAFDLPYIDVTENLTTAGTWFTYPTIQLTGPASGFIVDNLTTGEKLVYNALVSDKETITIDLRFGRKTVTSTFLGLTTKVNVIGALSADSDIATFHLAPDPEAPLGVNQVRIYVAGGDAQTALTVSWYDRYVGI